MLSSLNKIMLIIEYDGTRYHGLQWQVNLPTIQGEVELALNKLTGEKTRIAAASRTDARVHAREQVISFRTRADFPPQTWVKAINFYLSKDIAVKAAYKVSDDFDVRRRALSREYHYYILNSPIPSPLMQRFTYFVPKPLDLEAMNSACQALIGEHDFAPFAPPTDRSTIRRVYEAKLCREENLVIFKIVASSFLLHQVRNTVGSLLKVGLAKIGVDSFWELLRCKQAGLAGPTVPAHALCLVRINYSNFPPQEQ